MHGTMGISVSKQHYGNSTTDAIGAESRDCPSQEERRAIEKILDTAYYLKQNPDLKAEQMDPVFHFYHFGWRENRNPSPFFDVQFYLNAYPDVAAAGINPVIHYVWNGAQEGRLPRRPLDSLRKRLETAVSPRRNIAAWASAACKGPALSIGELEHILCSAASNAGLVVSFSHDDYLNYYGGVQNVIGEEQQALNKKGWNYLHVAPTNPLPILSDETSANTFSISLRINGEQVGLASFRELTNAVSLLRKRNDALECIVHHLLGFSPELIDDFLSKAGFDQPVFWIHDFFSICPNYVLMRNNLTFCGGPDPESGGCRICCYGAERKEHFQRINRLFQKVVPRILAPSWTALELWKASGGLQHQRADVVPLARLVRAPQAKSRTSEEPLRVGFTGALAFHKGWEVFEELACRHVNDDRYLFFQLGYLGEAEILPANVRHESVNVSRENCNDMVEAVAKMRIDLIVNWSLWPETFCFTALEGLAGGAFVAARASAGNVWPLIEANAPDQGRAIYSRRQLFDLFQNGEIRNIVRNANCRYGTIMRGKGTADWPSWISSKKALSVPRIIGSNQHPDEMINQ
jgi:hypothetical protein